MIHRAKLIGVTACAAALGSVSRHAGKRFLIGQLAAMPGLPAKAAQQLGVLTGNSIAAPAPLGKGLMLELIQDSAPGIAREIRELSDRCWPASLGQVQEAILRDGRRIAIKVQYPGMESVLADELELLLQASALAPFPIDRQRYGAFFKAALAEELDYEAEARHQRQAREFARPDVTVPEVLFAAKNVLAQEFVPCSPPLQDPGLAKALAFFALDGIFGHGLLHGDLHPGNWGKGGRGLVVYDFGAMVELSPGETAAFRALRSLVAAGSKDGMEYQPHFEALGFRGLAPLIDRLPALANVWFSPLLPRFSGFANFGARAAEALGEHRSGFRAAGSPKFFQILRTLGAVLSAFPKLGAPCLGDYEPLKSSAPIQAARHLRVRVSDGGETRVDLSMPARSAAKIPDLIPEEARKEIVRQGIDVFSIARAAERSGFQAAKLFSAKVGTKEYHVWLE